MTNFNESAPLSRTDEIKLAALKDKLKNEVRIQTRVLNKECTDKHMAMMPILSTFLDIVRDTIDNKMPLHGAN